ncbi:MAG: hypothetical protein IPK76_22845 [Lewinellaceae bacterium]|nr:hypothetical protein [Lewinellaceae bacterium]
MSITTGGSALEQNSNLSASQDLDPDPENELQTPSLSGATLSITDGNSVTFPGSIPTIKP